jgi:hypothetical protein
MAKGFKTGGRQRITTHGEITVPGQPSPEYVSYHAAMQRCNDPKHIAYKSYGERGIEFRFTSFEQFLAEVGRKPTSRHTIDRKDPGGHYEPGNVRWATRKEQARNFHRNRHITVAGETRLLCEWVEKLGHSSSRIAMRLHRGWCDECAVTLPVRRICPHRNVKRVSRLISSGGRTQTLAEWAKETGIDRVTLADRLNRGETLERAVSNENRERSRNDKMQFISNPHSPSDSEPPQEP